MKYVIDFSTRLGRGTGGIVRQGTNVTTDEKVAIKEMVQSTPMDDFVHAASILEECKHENVVKLLDIIIVGKKNYMVFEWMYGDLLKFRKRLKEGFNRGLTEDELRRIMTQLMASLAFLHDQGVVHQDIKSANVLVDKDGTRVKLCDFDQARRVSTPARDCRTIGTLSYNAPEIILGKQELLGTAIDVWGAGVIFLELVLGYNPFNMADNVEEEKLYLEVERIQALVAKNFADPDMRDLLLKMLQWDPDKRCTATEALSSEFLRAETEVSQLCADMLTQCVV